jgi:hypothetical protein
VTFSDSHRVTLNALDVYLFSGSMTSVTASRPVAHLQTVRSTTVMAMPVGYTSTHYSVVPYPAEGKTNTYHIWAFTAGTTASVNGAPYVSVPVGKPYTVDHTGPFSVNASQPIQVIYDIRYV